MCYGHLQRKRPTALGQADYYGATANTAARIMAHAQPGQVLIEGNLPFHGSSHAAHKMAHTLLVNLSGQKATCIERMILQPMEPKRLKGLPNLTPIFRVRYRGSWLVQQCTVLLISADIWQCSVQACL